MTTGIDKALLRQLLSVGAGWDVTDYELDLRKQRCDVWIAPQVERSWFGRAKTHSGPTEQHVWRHLAFGRTRFVIHVSAPAGTDLTRMIWAGDPGMPFTRALAQHVFLMFNEGLTIEAICKLHGLSLNEVWKYRFAVDNGLVNVQSNQGTTPPAAIAAAQPAQAAAPQRPAAPTLADIGGSTDGVPDVADPVWMQLVSGELKLDIRVLSLKLMLTKVRSQLEVINDDEVRMLKLRDLHRYFLKNERALSYELAQIRG